MCMVRALNTAPTHPPTHTHTHTHTPHHTTHKHTHTMLTLPCRFLHSIDTSPRLSDPDTGNTM